MKCFDIHKSLAPYIRHYIKKTDKEIFPQKEPNPDFNAIANEAYEAFQRDPLGKSLQPDLSDSKD